MATVTDAEVLVTEGRRTLQQARDAVKASDLSRGFYNPGHPWAPSGKGSSKGFSKGKSGGKSKGKTKDGGCTACGSMHHWWKDCPYRGKGKSGGKSKGYWVDDVARGYFFTVALSACFFTAAQSVGKAIIDTGATQTVGGIEAVQMLLDRIRVVVSDGENKEHIYSVDPNDRPWFHFWDGGWLQALSRIWIRTKIGSVGICTLAADKVPISELSDPGSIPRSSCAHVGALELWTSVARHRQHCDGAV